MEATGWGIKLDDGYVLLILFWADNFYLFEEHKANLLQMFQEVASLLQTLDHELKDNSLEIMENHTEQTKGTTSGQG